MRDIFRGYYHPTEEEESIIWEGGLIALDTNILLSLYRVQSTTADLYLKALQSRASQMWCSHQVGAEFHRHVHQVRNSQTKDHGVRIKAVQTAIDTISNTATQSRFQETEKQQLAVVALKAFKEELTDQQAAIGSENDPKKLDELLRQISDLFDGKVGPAPSQEELELLNETGKTRFENEQPPGYGDKKKDGDRAYGDYIFWQQVMDQASREACDIILVTDDDKNDWWIKGGTDGKLSLAPRPELIQEVRKTTSQEILIYNSRDFYAMLLATQSFESADEKAIQAAEDDLSTVVRNYQATERSHGEGGDNQLDFVWDIESGENVGLRSARKFFVGETKLNDRSDIRKGDIRHRNPTAQRIFIADAERRRDRLFTELSSMRMNSKRRLEKMDSLQLDRMLFDEEALDNHLLEKMSETHEQEASDIAELESELNQLEHSIGWLRDAARKSYRQLGEEPAADSSDE